MLASLRMDDDQLRRALQGLQPTQQQSTQQLQQLQPSQLPKQPLLDAAQLLQTLQQVAQYQTAALHATLKPRPTVPDEKTARQQPEDVLLLLLSPEWKTLLDAIQGLGDVAGFSGLRALIETLAQRIAELHQRAALAEQRATLATERARLYVWTTSSADDHLALTFNGQPVLKR